MSKKVWNSCKILLLVASAAFAQTKNSDSNNLPTMPSMPTMPSVSRPSVGSGFYSPGRSDFYSGWNPKQNQQTKSSKTNTDDSKNQTAQNTNSSTNTTQTNQQTAQIQAQKLNTLAKSASSSLNQLTADDISSLNNLGAFSQLSGLLGKNQSSSLLATQNTVTANTIDSATLKQILAELTELKNQINNSDSKSTETTLSEKSAGASAFTTPVKKEPQILRFNVNGYDILSTCKKIYFSETESDGTFLLTGDRKYMSENKARTETFYFYFCAKGNENGVTKYTVTPAVSQDYENEYSYLYQLTQKSNLTANRTGNLVTLRVSDGSWKMDMLLSLDK